MTSLTDLTLGAEGDAVLLLQERLAALGFAAGSDGVFTKDLETIVRDFQISANLAGTGEADTGTWRALGIAVNRIEDLPLPNAKKWLAELNKQNELTAAEEHYKLALPVLPPPLDGVALLPDGVVLDDDWSTARKAILGGDRPGLADVQSYVHKAASAANRARERSGRQGGSVIYPETAATRWGRQYRRQRSTPGPMDPTYQFWAIGLALSGGGSKGDFELGAVRYIYDVLFTSREANRSGPQIVTGTSVGAVNAAKLAEGGRHGLDELEHLWFGLRTNSDMYRLNVSVDAVMARAVRLGTVNGGAALISALTVLPLAFLFVADAFDQAQGMYETIVSQRSIWNLEPIQQKAQADAADWSATGPGSRGAGVAAARDVGGRLVVVARGVDDHLYVRCQLEPAPLSLPVEFTPWVDLGGPVSSSPALVATPSGHLTVAARSADETWCGFRVLWGGDGRQDANWRPWEPVEPPEGGWPNVRLEGAPTMVAAPRPAMYMRDEHNQAYVSEWVNERWQRWRPFGGFVVRGQIAAAATPDGWRLAVARNAGGTPIGSWCGPEGQHGPWASLARLGEVPPTNGDPAVLVNMQGRVDVFCRGMFGGGIWVRQQSGAGRDAWAPWRLIGGVFTGSPVPSKTSHGTGVLFARGLDRRLWVNRQPSYGGAWGSGWTPVDGHGEPVSATDCFVAVGHDPDQLDVLTVAEDARLFGTTLAVGATVAQVWHALEGRVWSGMKLRLAMVALEDNEVAYVDEAGAFVGKQEPPVPLVKAILASAAIPVVFPPETLNGRAWVDGGVGCSTPIRAALDAGADEVFAISASAAVPPLQTEFPRSLREHGWGTQQLTRFTDQGGLFDIGRRALDLLPAAIMDSDLNPETPWQEPVWVIQPSFDIHDALTIEPGLIRINYAYGYMRAADVWFNGDNAAAMTSSDEIIRLRFDAWRAEEKARRSHLEFVFRPATERWGRGIAGWEAAARQAGERVVEDIRVVRALKRELAAALRARLTAGFELPSLAQADFHTWSSSWEAHGIASDIRGVWPETVLPEGTLLQTQPPASPFSHMSFRSWEGSTIAITAEEPPRVV